MPPVVSPLQGSLAAQIYKGMKGLFLDATYTVDAVPDSPAYDPADPPAPVAISYACKAIVETYSDYFRKQNLVTERDRKVLVLANSLAVVPVVNARITISGITFAIIAIGTDPATAVWEIQGRM